MPRRPKLHSQEMRLRAPAIDSLRLATGYSLADLGLYTHLAASPARGAMMEW